MHNSSYAPDAPTLTRPLTLTPAPLSALQKQVLQFEQQWSQHHRVECGNEKARAIRRDLGLQWAHYFQVLNTALDHPQAERFDAALVRHLRRLRTHAA